MPEPVTTCFEVNTKVTHSSDVISQVPRREEMGKPATVVTFWEVNPPTPWGHCSHRSGNVSEGREQAIEAWGRNWDKIRGGTGWRCMARIRSIPGSKRQLLDQFLAGPLWQKACDLPCLGRFSARETDKPLSDNRGPVMGSVRGLSLRCAVIPHWIYYVIWTLVLLRHAGFP